MIEALRTLVPYMVRYRWRYAAGFTALVLTVLTSATIPALIGYTVDELNRSFSMELTVKLGGALLFAGLMKGVFQFWMRWVLIGISRDIEYDLRNDLFARLVVQSQRFYQNHRTGDLMSRATNDMNAVRLMLGPGVMYTADVTMTFIILLGVMSSTDWRLTLAIFVPIPLVSFTVSFFGRRIHDRFQTVQEKFSDISSLVQENLSNVRIVRAYAQEEADLKHFQQLNEEFVARTEKLIRVWGMFYPALEVMMGAVIVMVLWLGGREVARGAISIGSFVAFNVYVGQLAWPMIALGWVVNLYQRGTASLKRLTGLLVKAIGDPSYRMTLHTAPNLAVKIVQGEWDTIERDYHWHLEFLVYPERAMWVAGIAVTDMLPEEAARVLREAGSLEQPRADWRPSPG